MKNTLSAILLTVSTLGFSQVIIGDNIGTAPANKKGSVLLEFANTGNKGIILPYVRTLPASPTEGTILLDASTATAARVKYYAGTVKGWVDLSGQDANITTSLADQPTALQVTESSDSRAIIGDVPNPLPTGFPDGVLVLNSTTKAMVLPIVSSTDSVPNPSPGMMVYINGTNKRLAVYNGSKWSYWMP